MEIDPENIILTENVNGHPVSLMMIEVWDGLYTPVGVRKPEGSGPTCLLYTSPSPRDGLLSRMPSSA